jgi:transposase-like protein
MNARQKRGKQLAASSKIEFAPGGFSVPSASGMGTYFVQLGSAASCNCLDFQANKPQPCKHIHAARFFADKEAKAQKADGPRVPRPKPPSLIELAETYDTREKCLALLESLRWPHGPTCPRCECNRAYRIEARQLFECAECEYQYSAIVGTVMMDTRLSLTKWIMAVALLCNARKGVSACQVSRDLHVTYKTAWYLCHRIRRAMRETKWLEKFTGIVEVDETYVGGKTRGGPRGRGAKNKEIVFGVKERDGKVRIQTIANITAETLRDAVVKYVSPECETVMADQLNSYNQLAAEFTMKRINHTKEYVNGEIHTNGMESIWAILKRQVYGTHHRMSPQYLPLYLGEINYRFNHRTEHDLFLSVLRNGMMTDKQLTAPQHDGKTGLAEGEVG